MTEVGKQLDAALEQENADCVEEGLVTSKDKKESSIYRKIEIPNDKELKEST